ncbi:hypothetical protein [Terricaulis sp.]|uniref:hypothetical protein n=1 Tax=Terricaulis sp. TaxID=2768686 RepID=UPI00378478CB
MVRNLCLTIAALALAGCAQTVATRPPSEVTASVHEDLLGRIVGSWVLTGVIAGRQTTHDVEAIRVLGRNYVRLDEVSRELGEDGRPAYEATIYVGWLESRNQYVCIWLDNTEVATGDVTCVAGEAVDAIPFEFRDRDGALLFTNTFTFNRGDDSWEWRMVNVRGDQRDTFGVVTLRRR